MVANGSGLSGSTHQNAPRGPPNLTRPFKCLGNLYTTQRLVSSSPYGPMGSLHFPVAKAGSDQLSLSSSSLRERDKEERERGRRGEKEGDRISTAIKDVSEERREDTLPRRKTKVVCTIGESMEWKGEVDERKKPQRSVGFASVEGEESVAGERHVGGITRGSSSLFYFFEN